MFPSDRPAPPRRGADFRLHGHSGQDGHSGLAVPTLHAWPTARWCALLSCGSSRSIRQLALPFALIGSHPLCGIRITDRRVPAVAYFACAFDDSIEVWPLCPLAFPQWDVVSSQHAILVGQHRIRLMHETHLRWQQVSSDTSESEDIYSYFTDPRSAISLFQTPAATNTRLDLELQWDGTRHAQPFARRVIIVGADHPSTLRLRDLGLSLCDHALVASGDSVWTIRLDLNASDQNLANLVTQVRVGDPPLKIKQLRIRAKPAATPSTDACFQSDDFAPQTSADGTLNLIADRCPKAETMAGVSPPEISLTAIHQATTNTSPDALMAGVTERLIQLAHSKKRRPKLLACTAIFATAITLFAGIIHQMLWPLVSKFVF